MGKGSNHGSNKNWFNWLTWKTRDGAEPLMNNIRYDVEVGDIKQENAPEKTTKRSYFKSNLLVSLC